MYLVISILIVFISILLSLIVLVQDSKGGGLSANFSSSNQIMGVRKTTDFLEKSTWVLVIAVVVLSVASVAFRPKDHSFSNESEIKEQIERNKPVQPITAPSGLGGEQAPVSSDAPQN